MRIKLSDGVREVEVEMADNSSLSALEEVVTRLYSVVAPTDEAGKRQTGFSAGGWSTLSETERQPEE